MQVIAGTSMYIHDCLYAQVLSRPHRRTIYWALEAGYLGHLIPYLGLLQLIKIHKNYTVDGCRDGGWIADGQNIIYAQLFRGLSYIAYRD